MRPLPLEMTKKPTNLPSLRVTTGAPLASGGSGVAASTSHAASAGFMRSANSTASAPSLSPEITRQSSGGPAN